MDGAEEAIRIHYYNTTGTGSQKVILIKSNDLMAATSSIWKDLKDGINNGLSQHEDF